MGFAESGRDVQLRVEEPELFQHREVANRERSRGTPAGELVERGQLLGGEQRISQRHVRDSGRQPNTRGSLRRCGQDQPGVAMVDLVRQKHRVQPNLIRRADG